jgi:ubiquinone/menaquinone biosynthesis C-methylase UbiE
VDAKLQRRVQRYGWDRAAEYYERCWEEQLKPAQQRLLQRAELRPGERVLDVACGTGLVTFPAAEAVGATGEVIGTDISDEMVRVCRETAARRGVAHVRFERMEAETIAFPDASFDAVLCGLGLMYVTDFEGSVREIARVLREGGRASVAVWGRRSHCGWAEIFPIVESRVKSDVCPLFFQLGTGNLLAQLFARAGLRDVVSDVLTTELIYEDPGEACRAAFAGGPVAMAYSRFDDATRESAHADYLASIEPFRANGAYRIPGEFVVVCGTR